MNKVAMNALTSTPSLARGHRLRGEDWIPAGLRMSDLARSRFGGFLLR